MTFGWIFVFFCAVYHGAETEWVVGNGSGSWIGASSTCPGGRIAVPTLGSGDAVRMDSNTLEGDVISMHWVGVYRRRQYIKYIGCTSTSTSAVGNFSDRFVLSDSSLTACIELCSKSSNTLVVGMMTKTCLCYTTDNFQQEDLLTTRCFIPCTDQTRFTCGDSSSISMYKLERASLALDDYADDPGQCVSIQSIEVNYGQEETVFYNRNCEDRLRVLCENNERQLARSTESKTWTDVRAACNQVFRAVQIDGYSFGNYAADILKNLIEDDPLWTAMTYISNVKFGTSNTNGDASQTLGECGYVTKGANGLVLNFTNCARNLPAVCEGTTAATTTKLPRTIRSSTKLTTQTSKVIADITQVSTDVSTDTPQISNENGSDTVVIVAVVTVLAVVILGVCAVVGVICYRKRQRHNVPCDDIKNDDQPVRQSYDSISLEPVGESRQGSQAHAQGAGANGSATGSYVYAKVNKNRLNAAGTVHDDDGRIYSTANEPEHTYNRANFGTSDNDVYDHTDGVCVPKKGVTHVSANIYNRPMFSVDTENMYDHSIGHSHNGMKIYPGKLTENTYGVIKSKDDNVYDTTSTSTSAPSAEHGHVITENAYASTSTSAEAFSPTDTVN